MSAFGRMLTLNSIGTTVGLARLRSPPISWEVKSPNRKCRIRRFGEQSASDWNFCYSTRAGCFAVEEPCRHEHTQFAQLVNRQCNVTVLTAEVFREVEQKSANRIKGLVAIGNEAFSTGVGADGKKDGWFR